MSNEPKKLKRSLFISSLLMVLLLIVALSTATFAWFSASNVVNIAQISFQAAVIDDGAGGGDLAISWDENDREGIVISFNNNNNMNPMIPVLAPTVGLSYSDFIAHDAFYTATEKDGVYATVPRMVSPTLCLSPDGDEVFYLRNLNTEYMLEITLSYEITGENAEALCVAVFAEDRLVGVMSNADRLYYGTITQGAPTAEQSSVDAINQITFSLPADSAFRMRLVSWYSGHHITNSGAQKTATLNYVRFSGSYAG